MPTITRHYDPWLQTTRIRPGIYLDGVNKTMIDVGGNNLGVTDGKVVLLNNQTNIYGRGNGQIEWLQIASNSADCYTPTATVRMKYNNAMDCGTTTGGDWGPMGYFVADSNCTSTEWEFNDYGTATVVKVYRGAYDVQSGWIKSAQPSAAALIKKIIADRCAPNFIRNRHALDNAPDIREIRARQTLHRVIGDEKFRNFIRNGFITVRGKSGKSYQIFPGHGITSVWFCGKMVERLCVILRGDFPPTDSLIMRYLLILNNEQEFRAKANISSPTQLYKSLPKEPDKRTLAEIFSSMKNPLKKTA